MIHFNKNDLEETVKIKVHEYFFSKYTYTQIGRIDFAISKGNTQLDIFNNDTTYYYLWAEAKKGENSKLEDSFVQLILTIGKEKTFNENLPPLYLGAFDCNQIAFINYSEISDVFLLNDFNWNVVPSNHNTKEFQSLKEKVKLKLKKSLIFKYSDENVLKEFIKKNFKIKKDDNNQIEIDKNNFISIYHRWMEKVKPTININWKSIQDYNIIDADFYLADLLSEDNVSIKQSLFVLLNKDHYEYARTIDELGNCIRTATFSDNQYSYNQFWAIYKRPPKKLFCEYIIKRRDLLVPQDIRERKGSYFTPKNWVEKSQEYITKSLGEEWQETYYIWDCCAGTGNLLNGLTDKYKIWASTIDPQDVDVMKDRIKNGANLLESHVFQFDFLNDTFTDPKFPKELFDIITNVEKRKKLVIYINPPYAEPTSSKTIQGGNKHKSNVSDTKIKKEYFDDLKQGSKELAVQFIYRIYKEINGCILANFSTPKIIQGLHYREFMNKFKAKLKSMFISPADTFDNVKGKFPIGFFVWDTSIVEDFKSIYADVYDKNSVYIGKKLFYHTIGRTLKDWLREYQDKNNTRLCYLVRGSSDVQNNHVVFLTQKPSDSVINAGNACEVTKDNFSSICIFFAIRNVIDSFWYNNKDQYNYPDTNYKNDIEFINDCIIYTSCSISNNDISYVNGINYFIPFKENDINPKNNFKSNFLSDYIKKLELSEESKNLLNACKELFVYYHSKSNSEPNASIYDIKYFFCYDKLSEKFIKCNDNEYNNKMMIIKFYIDKLKEKIIKKVYKYRFLINTEFN